MDDLSSTQGIVALVAAGVAAVALVWVIVLAVKLRRIRAAQRTILGESDADLVAHAASLQEAFVQLRDWVEEVARGLESRVGASEHRMDGCIAHTSVVRYDAMNELSGQQSSTVALLDERRTGVVISSILHRDQARLYVKQVREGNPEFELSPEEQQAVDEAMAGDARARLMRVGYLGPAGTHSDEALRASAPPGAEAVPYPTIYDAVMAVQDGRGRARDRADRERARGQRRGHTRHAGGRGRARAHRRRRSSSPIHHCVVARASCRCRRVERVVSHPQATAQCARFLREHLPGAEHVSAPSTADAVLTVCRSGDASVALGSRLAAELYDCHIVATNVEDHPDNVTRFVWLAPADEVGEPGPDAKTSVVFWGGGDQSPGWLVDVLQRARRPRREPDPDRVAAAAHRARALHVLRRPRGRRRATRRSTRRSTALARRRSSELRVLGSYGRPLPG